MSLLQDYSTDFPPEVIARGEEYQRRGAVNVLDQGPGWVEAEVEGTRIYRSSIDYKPDRGLTYQCSCEYFEDRGPCKHLWALVLQSFQQGSLPRLNGTGKGNGSVARHVEPDPEAAAATDAEDFGEPAYRDEPVYRAGPDGGARGGDGEDADDDEDAAALPPRPGVSGGAAGGGFPSVQDLRGLPPQQLMEMLRNRPPPRRPRPAGPAAQRGHAEDAWKGQLDRLSEAMRMRPAAAPRPLGWPAGRRLLYVVDVEQALDAGLIVLLMHETPKRDGTFERAKLLRLTQSQITQLPDPVDRRIIQLLNGTGRSGYGSYYDMPLPEAFEVDESAYEDMLRTLCQTGRLRLRTRDGATLVPVTWDDGPAWEFCLQIRPSPGGRYLLLDGSLRRPATAASAAAGDEALASAGEADGDAGLDDELPEGDDDDDALLIADDEGEAEGTDASADADAPAGVTPGAAPSDALSDAPAAVEAGEPRPVGSAKPQAAVGPEATTGAGTTDITAARPAEPEFESVPLSEPPLLLDGVGEGFVFQGGRVARLRHYDAFPLISALREGEKISVPLDKQGDLLKTLLKFPRLPRLDLPPDLDVKQVSPAPRPRLKLISPGRGTNGGPPSSREGLLAKVTFDYDGLVVDSADAKAAVLVDDGQKLVRRDTHQEAVCLADLPALGFREEQAYGFNNRELRLPLAKMPKAVADLTRRGWTVEADGKLYRSAGQVNVSVSSGIDWFELRGEVSFDGLTASLPRLLEALRKGETVVRLDDGTYGLLPEEWLKKYAGLAGLGEADGDHIKFTGRQIGFLDAMLSAMPEARFDETFARARDELMRFGGIEAVTPPDTFVGTLRQYQQEGLGWMAFLRKFAFGGVLADDMGLGKAQPLDAKVLTPTGWKRMGDVCVGDAVVNARGGTSRVTGVYPQGEKEIYRVVFSDGSATECCDEHLWQVTTPVRRYRGDAPRVLPLSEIRQTLTDGSGNRRHFVPMVEPVRFAERELPLHPYLLGVLLGDGGIAHRVILSSADAELVGHAATLLPAGTSIAYTGTGVDYRIRSRGRGISNRVADELRKLGLFGCRSEAKFVPDDYKFTSAGDRLEVLRGLLDTDGHVRPADNNIEFCSVSRRLAEDVRFLVQSLGGTARVRTKRTTGQLAYRMSIALPAGVVPFRLRRKADVYRPRGKYPPSRAIAAVEPVGRKPAQCIRVDAADHLYVTDDFVVTHNTVQVLALLEARRRERVEHSENSKTNVPATAGGGAAAAPPATANGPARKPPVPCGPSLVVAPRSLVFNWKAEAEKFAPGLRVLDHTAVDRVRSADHFGEYDMVVTTYGTLRRDMSYFKDVRFDYAILDEAQAIKNAASESAKAARLVRADHRLALSGTPVQNHLGELWSLFDFLNPGMMGNVGVFRDLSADAANRDATARELLARSLRPFILRRTKEQVARDLPEKLEQTIYCELEKDQRKMYDELRDHYRTSLLDRVAKEGMNKAKIMVLEALLRLRQAACHPGLIDKTRTAEPSAKLDVLMDHLAEVADEGHKVLVFSQFTSLLGIVKDRLDKQQAVYEYLDGRTKDRQARVDRFQSDPDCKLFLISLKAGGVGLNLTAAEYVFLLDPWWNPAVEAQAIDRAHRIGQTRRVFAYRLIAKDTVEEKVIQLQQSKRDLADAIISADNSLIRGLSREDLEMLLS